MDTDRMRQWYALRTKPKKEAWAASLLDRAGVEVYLPTVKVRKQTGRQPATEPFFPGYMFCRLDPEAGEIRLATYTSGIQYVVGYAGEPWPVPDRLVIEIKARLAEGHSRAMLASIKAGDRLVITSGPFKDLEAIFDQHLSPSGRVRVLIQLLGRLCRADLNAGQVRKVTKAASAA